MPLACFQRRRLDLRKPYEKNINGQELTVLTLSVLTLISKSDSPSYTMLYCLPPHLHDFYIAVRALNIELSRIPDTVSHPTVGTMRMQFWRQAIASTLEGSPPRGQPVTILLASALESLSHRRSGSSSPPPSMKSWFNRLISARESRLTSPPFPDLTSLESYAESTYSTILYILLSALPIQSLTLDHLASHIGKSAGIIAILRGFPLIAFPSPSPSHHNNPTNNPLIPGAASPSQKQGSITLPLDVLSQHSIRDQDIYDLGPQAPGLRDAVFTVATRASDHLITARTMLENIRAGQGPGHECPINIRNPIATLAGKTGKIRFRCVRQELETGGLEATLEGLAGV
ncbi:putative squalene phytoene synthase [Phaeomoniella chlamydospora]|uniref:Putative squalene phytoene synthase n=1 Tax=Phaeomoniella chlamydospora TaxID=158046 RepID=A0A0G2F0T6_PHACM|nr:putative squalene phytoene synthase [Phaeomoniella chlamydospora]